MPSILDLGLVEDAQYVPVRPTVALLGVGSMGGAILTGLRGPDSPVAAPIRVTTQRVERARALEAAVADDVLVWAAEADPDANRDAVRGAALVVLAVKPRLIHDLLRDIAAELAPGATVVSVAAGVTSASMEALVRPDVSVVRAMPNTPARIGRGVTGVAAGASASSDAVALVRRVFETVGQVLVIDEARIDALTAVSGSGPAYLFLFAEEFAAAAERLGFSRDDARLLAEGTVTGAAELLARSGEEPAELRRQVTSPNGTTERAIQALQAGDLGGLFDRALAAAVARAQELAAE